MTFPTLTLKLYNTLTRRKDDLVPLDPKRVRMYVCGPTVYDFAHIGNARPVIVFDVLFRLLRHVYGAEHVIYARNITDVDDKINARAAEEHKGLPLNEAIARVTTATTAQFHADIAALGVLPPSVEPTCTGHIDEMVAMIGVLVGKGAAYAEQGHVLLDTTAVPDYGRLSGLSLEEMIAGARVEVAPYKRNPADSVLWKPSTDEQPGWPSPWGRGRPGWHIECSAMAAKHLGQVFDIHGGGIDLVFPHHENEVAQSRAAHGTAGMANIWMHNGFLQVNGEKMSKSLGNFITVNQLLATRDFGGQSWHGHVMRLAMLGTHYRQPIDWTVERLVNARALLMELAETLKDVPDGAEPHTDIMAALADDLNTPSAISIVHGLLKSVKRGNGDTAARLKSALALMGVLDGSDAAAYNVGSRKYRIDQAKVASLIDERLAARNSRDFKASDRIRDELAAMGVRIKDSKDATTGAPTTTWEIAG